MIGKEGQGSMEDLLKKVRSGLSQHDESSFWWDHTSDRQFGVVKEHVVWGRSELYRWWPRCGAGEVRVQRRAAEVVVLKW